ncbi:thiol-activated cytolysin family protein [Pedobacter borealis]|uniref:thiol-activated cytolysin family protein n=1 Tax=Pedobacter borealis TaxID=475254 RepID=UPI00049332F9|nr:thiol-activated cytolysin family protein [Pedobacter borealis]
MEKQQINEYIRGLKYDHRELLSTVDSAHPETLPGRSQSTSNSVIICTNTPKKLTKEISDISILSPSNGVIYPGALILANRNLAEGKPQAITLQKSPLTLRVDLPGLDKNGIKTIEQPKNVTVETEINNIASYWQENVLSKGQDHVARMTYSVTKAYSDSQLSIDLGFSTKWADNEIKNKFHFEKKTNSSTTVAMFKQIYYTATIDLPETPATVFGDNVSLEDVKAIMSSENPPAYVKSVDYGRIIMVRMDTNSSETKSDMENTMKMLTAGGTSIEASAKNKYEAIARNSTFTVLVLGGGAKISSDLFGGESFSKIQNIIKGGIQLNKENPAYPISYTVNFLKDHQFAVMPMSTDYVETECVEYPSGYVRIVQEGGYVGKWEVTWNEKDGNGNNVGHRFDSGNVTSPYQRTVDLPGDANNVRIKAWAKTGLVWDPWREAISVAENGPTNKTYKIWGTTLSPKHGIS